MAVWHGMSARGVRNKHLKDLWEVWRGLLLSYDEGVIKGDAVMASAVWRSIFKAKEDVNIEDVAIVAAYIRRELQRLGDMSDQQISTGEVAFSSPGSVRRLLEKESPWMRKTLTAEEEKNEDGEKI